ncbi:hypothetical protein CWE09_07225 [Aliidiomarina minuta]|uniref:GGDEF-domain containing protein n=1 Tax=Aliidiomarina minuta TaxID=880057 RepID=A0A432W8W2_9GAMM|nr:EAL domain-containing protein [Aliidiomarina minuta]RUO26491.1 hypothetical protein CWE09_07225 [Aliidiomarina minuta]
MRFLLLVLVLLSASLPSEASNTLRLQQLSVQEGLSQNSVTRIVKDHEGFLWVATEGGLNRYDGYSFHHVPGPGNQFLDAYVSTINITSDGSLWVALPSQGVFQLPPQGDDFILHIEARMIDDWWLDEVIAIKEYQNQLLIISESHVRLYDPETQEVHQIFELQTEDGNFEDIIRSHHLIDDIIILATSAGVIALTPEDFSAVNLWHLDPEAASPDMLNTKAFAQFEQRLFVATVQGLYSWQLDTLTTYITEQDQLPPAQMHESQMNIWDLHATDNSLYMATHQGLYEYRASWQTPEQLLRFSDANLNLFDNSIRTFYYDSNQQFWLGTAINGLFHWQPASQNFTSLVRGIAPVEELSHNVVWALAEDIDNRLWIGTQNGLNMLTPDNQLQTYLESDDEYSMFTSGTIFDIFPDPQVADKLWLYLAGEIVQFDAESGDIEKVPTSDTESTEIMADFGWGYRLLEDHKIWFFITDGLVSYDIQTGQAKIYKDTQDDGFNALNAYHILGTRQGHPDQILLGLASELWIFDTRDSTFEKVYQHEPYQLYSYIAPESHLVDQDNKLWITMEGAGIAVLDNDTLEFKFRLQTTDGLPTNAVYSAQPGLDGEIWFSSHSGLLRVNPVTLHVEQFTYQDGISGNEFNARATGLFDDGVIAYGGMRGVTMFHPDNFQRSPQPPKVSITDVDRLTSRERLNLPLRNLNQQRIHLDYDENNLRVHVSTLQYDRQHRVQYDYHLSGPTTFSVLETTDRYVTFPRLQPGSYQLTVNAYDSRSGVRGESAILYIEVGYHPFFSPLAISLYVLSVLLIAAFLIYYRYQQHQQVIRNKKRAEASEERLQLALSITGSGVWDWHQEENQLYENRIRQELGHTVFREPLSIDDHLQLIHPQDQKLFEQRWTQLIKGTAENFACTYRMRHQDGGWLWFTDLGKVSGRNQSGIPKRITGTFQNITEARANREKALLFGKAFEQTMDWVLLLNADFLPLTANKAFCNAVAIEDMENIKDYDFTRMSKQRLRNYRNILNTLKPGEQWRGEDVIQLGDQQETPVLMNISAVLDNNDQGMFYVVVITNISAQKEAEKQLRKLANYDSLTGLANRTLLHDRVFSIIQDDSLQKQRFGVIFIDLDRFKQVNDSLGHSVGDELLCIIASRLSTYLSEQDTVARLGGDEFIVLLRDVSNPEKVEQTARSIIDTINEPVLLQQHHIRTSPSLGIALYPEHGINTDELLKHADVAMYHAKGSGRNCYRIFEQEMDIKVRERLALETELKHAASHHQLLNYYQPIIAADSNHTVGVELLLRWQHKETFIDPDKFIPIAEDLGIIIYMTNQAMQQGLADLVEMRRIQPDLYLSVNLSVSHLDYPHLPAQVEQLLAEYQLPASALRFEITEGILIEETVRAGSVMRELRDLGIHLLLDDFGTGYSSLRYVKEFPVGIIKIDRSFTQDIGIDTSNEAIIDSILAMARNLDKTCIAEGVESEAQKRWLLARHCNLMQGFLFARPMPLNELLEWFPRH